MHVFGDFLVRQRRQRRAMGGWIGKLGDVDRMGRCFPASVAAAYRLWDDET
jgi:hypothetical protein